MQGLRVGVDVGGTFTDVTVFEDVPEDIQRVQGAKVPTTPDVLTGVLNALEQAAIDLSEVQVVSHGTTVATNALLTRSFPPSAMVTTRGFRDVLEIRRGDKDELWDAYKDVGSPYIPRSERFEVTERIDYKGDVVTPLDRAEGRKLAEALRKRGAESIAVCFINAYANSDHEDQMVEILEQEIPDAYVSSSASVLPEMFEYERFATTVANAVVAPLVGAYVGKLQSEMAKRGFRGEFLLLHSGGGVIGAAEAPKHGARLAASGLAAGAMATRQLASQCNCPNAIGVDMGGTSTDVSVVVGGEVRVTKEWSIEFGHPICFPGVDLVTIGAGGGSIAWVDEGGSLRSGPQSAGASPGPVAYDRGNSQPTTTDANLVLGRLGPTLLSGEVPLNIEAARRAIESRIAAPLSMSIEAAAHAIIEIANANMSDAVRLVSVRRGHDPRDFALVAFGGAGPLHGAAIAADLGIGTVIVPPQPGVFSALGCLLVDIRHDLSRTLLFDMDEADVDSVEQHFTTLENRAHEILAREGVETGSRELTRFIDLRYSGQWRSLSIPLGDDWSIAEVVSEFHDRHLQEHNFRRPETPVEAYRIMVRAIGHGNKAAFPRQSTAGASKPEPTGIRYVHFGRNGARESPVYQREDIGVGYRLAGPVVVDQLDTTTLVPPGATAVIDELGNVKMNLSSGKEEVGNR